MGKGFRMSRRAWSWTVGALVLALVIFAGAALSQPGASKRSTPQLTPAVRSQKLATQASEAASRGETQTALSLAEKSLKLDSSNATAKRVVAIVKDAAPASSSASPVSGGSAPSGAPATATAPTPVGPYADKVDDLSTLLPTSVSGWRSGSVTARGDDALVTFAPTSSSPEYRTTTRATFTVSDFATEAKAAAFVNDVEKRVYSTSGTTTQVGVVSGYSGTDGSRLFVFAFARGRFVFETLVNARPGVTTDLSPVAAALAASFSATR